MRSFVNLKPPTEAEFERLGAFLGKGEYCRAHTSDQVTCQDNC
jgi:hypothetical protein